MYHHHPHQHPDTLALYLQKLKYQDSLLRIYDPGSKQHQLSEEVISFQKAQESLPLQTATYWTFFDHLKLTFCKNKRVPTYSQSCLEWCPGQNTATGRSSTGERSRLQSWVIEHSARISSKKTLLILYTCRLALLQEMVFKKSLDTKNVWSVTFLKSSINSFKPVCKIASQMKSFKKGVIAVIMFDI